MIFFSNSSGIWKIQNLKLKFIAVPKSDIQEIKQHILTAFMPFNPHRIILFGSIPSADWDEYSDVDIIIVYETDKRFLDRLKDLYMSWNIPKAIDILAYTPAEFAEMITDNCFVQDAVKYGELLYERGR